MIGLKDLKDDEIPTYKEWSSNLRKEHINPHSDAPSWISIDGWLFNAKRNAVYDKETVCYHLCMENYNRIYHGGPGGRHELRLPSISPIEDGCYLCKTPMPDGIKMIALLEKL